ncbi:unnamed protein product [Fraxinus pennsylvanica]|uniref:Protein ENHANCED DISEASE RESISTANCE 2 C-terminal domain-containing protein n=1 Tax=Fraxinus pennsylvanica TaxID=56036 RepID=A0AAD2DIT3_9LAMI|nr:unnamed protein product [Fraxinus pennsylvanica]
MDRSQRIDECMAAVFYQSDVDEWGSYGEVSYKAILKQDTCSYQLAYARLCCCAYHLSSINAAESGCDRILAWIGTHKMPNGEVFSLRGPNYFAKKSKAPAGDWMLNPAGVDWVRSNSKLDHVLSRPDNRVMASLRSSKTPEKWSKIFIVAVNLQVPGWDHHSALSYCHGNFAPRSGIRHVDMGFLVESQSEEELPERLFGAVRICQIEMSSAAFVDSILTFL